MHVLNFSTELQNAEVSVTLLKSSSTTDALSAILKILGTNKETLAVESVFGMVNFLNSSFSNTLSKMYEKVF